MKLDQSFNNLCLKQAYKYYNNMWTYWSTYPY